MQDSPVVVVRKCYQAYIDGDRAMIESVIADDFHFTSPLDNRIDRAAYFARCWPNHEWITGYEFVHLALSGDQVYVTYIGQSSRGAPFRNTEILTVRGGRIVEVEVYFGWSVPHKAKDGGFVNSG